MRILSEAHETLLSCMRFGPDHVPHDEETDDRHPTALVFPPDKPHSSGPNQVWNLLYSISISELMYKDQERDLRNCLNVIDQLISGWGDAAVLVAAAEWRAARRAETEVDDP